MLTISGLTRLSRRATESKRRLADLVEKSALRIDSSVAWGQFLDAPRKTGQFGIFGTSAAIQILVASGHAANNPLISRAIAALPEIVPRTQSEAIYDQNDLRITFKETALLEAAEPGHAQLTQPEGIETILLSQLIDNHGWGTYYDPSDPDDSPRLITTAHALIALRRSRAFRSSEACEAILSWLCETAISDGPLPIHEAALALLALEDYESLGIAPDLPRRARQLLISQTAQWLEARNKEAMGEITSYHYWVLAEGSQHNHYVFYAPDIIASLALLRAGNPPTARRAVLDVVDFVCQEIAANGGLRAKSSQRIATVDQMWAYRLLDEFSRSFAANPRAMMTPPAYVIAAAPTRRLVAVATLIAVGALGTLLTVLDWVDVAVRATGGVLATVSLGLVASLLFVWLRGE